MKIALPLLFIMTLTTMAQGQDTNDLPRIPEPLQPLPSQWADSYKQDSEFQQTLPSDDLWWRQFNDATLDSLITAAEANNYNVLAAIKRIEAAKLAIKEAKAGYFPTIDASAGWSGQRVSGATGPEVVAAQKERYWSLGLSMDWEIDVFGRIMENVKAQKASWQATRAEYASVQIALAANIAKTYFDLRAQQTLLKIVNENIASQKKIYDMTYARYEAGLCSKLDITQSQMTVTSTEANLIDIKAAIETDINSLAILVGVYPSQLPASVHATDIYVPKYDGTPAVGVPVDMLRRRPDILQAEAQLAGLAAQCGIAKKDFLPTLSLSAGVGTDSRDIKNLFTKNSFGWQIAPTLSWTVFDGLARNYRSNAAKLNFEAGIDDYNNTVMNAWQEVQNAMVQYNASQEQIANYEKMIELSDTGLRLSVDLFRDGLIAYTDVKDMQLDLLEYQRNLVTTRAQLLSDLVEIYEALGGGWE